MASSRFSGDALKRNGSKLVVRNQYGRAVPTFSGSQGNDIKSNIESTELLIDRDVQVGALPNTFYQRIFAHFEGISGSSTYASTMAMVIIDAARSLGQNPMTVLDHVKSNSVDVATVYPEINKLRGPGDQEERTSPVINDNSIRYRNINP